MERSEFNLLDLPLFVLTNPGSDFVEIARNTSTRGWERARMPLVNEVFVDVTIATAQVLTLNATPQVIVPAPVIVGYSHIFLGAAIYMPFNSIAYNGVAVGEDFAISYTNGAGQIVGECETTGFIDQGSSQMRWVFPIAPRISPLSDVAPVNNAALVISLLGGEIATGNSPLKVRTLIMTVPSTW